MAEPSDRDREMATEISAKLLSRWANDVVFERFKREISEGLATVRAEGRREAIEECANLVNPGDWPTSIHRECAEEVNDAIRALAKPAEKDFP